MCLFVRWSGGCKYRANNQDLNPIYVQTLPYFCIKREESDETRQLQNRGNRCFYIVENNNNLIRSGDPSATPSEPSRCELLIQELYQRGSIVWFTSGLSLALRVWILATVFYLYFMKSGLRCFKTSLAL